MALTKKDLEAIQSIVSETVEKSVDSLAQDVASGFAEVHEKIDAAVRDLSDKINVKDGKLENTVERVDKHELQIIELQQKLA